VFVNPFFKKVYSDEGPASHDNPDTKPISQQIKYSPKTDCEVEEQILSSKLKKYGREGKQCV
jgi:hypothetical protein